MQLSWVVVSHEKIKWKEREIKIAFEIIQHIVCEITAGTVQYLLTWMYCKLCEPDGEMDALDINIRFPIWQFQLVYVHMVLCGFSRKHITN